MNSVHIVPLKDNFKTKEEYTEEHWNADCNYVKSVGKSTLTINLANYYKTVYLEEGRYIIR